MDELAQTYSLSFSVSGEKYEEQGGKRKERRRSAEDVKKSKPGRMCPKAKEDDDARAHVAVVVVRVHGLI